MSKVAGNAEAPEAQAVSESEIAVHWKEEATIYPYKWEYPYCWGVVYGRGKKGKKQH